MTDELNDTDINDMVPYERDDNVITKVKWPIDANDMDNRFLRDYDNVHKLMEDRQITGFKEAQRHIQSAMIGDTPVKQCKIDTILITCLIMIMSTIEFQSQCATG